MPQHESESPREPHLHLNSVSKRYTSRNGSIQAVDNISFDVNTGEFVTLIGPSGCGKTTTLRMIAGFEVPDSGTIRVNGRNVVDEPPHHRETPMVFQNYALFPHLTVFENIAYGLRARKYSSEAIQHDVAMACQMVNLVGMEARYTRELSGGQRQRVALARVLVLKPRLILFDEPLSSLDEKLKIQTRTEIKRVQQLLNITVLYVTQDQSEALSLSDRIVIMNRGKIAQIGTPQEIYNEPNTPFVADFIGNANFLDGEVLSVGETRTTIDVGPARFQVPVSQCDPDLIAGDSIILSVKPEGIHATSTPCDTRGQIDVAAFVGSVVEYKIAFGDAIITSLQPNTRGRIPVFTTGDAVGLDFDVASFRVYRT
ncbi:MAG: ABC transporter ATP-binding protein [Alkalispirochaeta sp.]